MSVAFGTAIIRWNVDDINNADILLLRVLIIDRRNIMGMLGPLASASALCFVVWRGSGVDEPSAPQGSAITEMSILNNGSYPVPL